MRVLSIASGSFQAQVWGITYTVNWSGDLQGFEFWFRHNAANSTSTLASQLAVGDEVSVAGRVDPTTPLIVNAQVVRDQSIITPRAERHKDKDRDRDHEDKDKHEDNQRGQGQGPDHTGINNRLNELFKQLQKLQDLFRSRGGGN